MAFSSDYAIIGAAADNFDCNSTTGWTLGTDNAVGLAARLINVSREGTSSIGMVGNAAGLACWYQDVSAGSRFRVAGSSGKDLHFWFRYSKGKSPPYLVNTSSAIVVRLYFGGTTQYCDYSVTQTGDLELATGWQVFQVSGTNGTAGGGLTNFDQDIHRVELRLTFANDNNDQASAEDPELLMDCWFAGTKINITSGTETLSSLQTYSDGNNSHGGDTFPLGLVQTQTGFVNLLCGLDIAGTLSLSETFILSNQFSEEVKHNITVNNGGTLQLGEKETGIDSTYAVRGCILAMPADRYANISVENGGTLRAYDTKFLLWRYIFLGGSSDSSSTVELIGIDFDSNETVYFRANTLDIDGVEVHDARYTIDTSVNDQAAEMSVSPDSCTNLLLYGNQDAMYFRDTLTIEELFTQDNIGNDVSVNNNETVTIINGSFDSAKVAQL